jgi:DNA-binding response OmpR family regulator
MNEALARELHFSQDELSLRVLLAEDNDQLRRLLALVLRNDGHEVVEARDGAELLETIATTLIDARAPSFDLVMCEQTLPGIPGLNVLAGLRARDRTTSFILLTGDEDVQRRALRLGAIILDHPFDLRAVQAAVRRSCESKPANDF